MERIGARVNDPDMREKWQRMEQREWSIPDLPVRWYSCAIRSPILSPNSLAKTSKTRCTTTAADARCGAGIVRWCAEVENAGAEDNDGDDMMAVKLELERHNVVDISGGRGQVNMRATSGANRGPNEHHFSRSARFQRVGWNVVGVGVSLWLRRIANR